MSVGEFIAEDWVDGLTLALPRLDKVQQPFLEEYLKQCPSERVLVDGQDVTPFPLGDLCHLYFLARHSGTLGGEEYYASLCEAIDPIRNTLRSHPTLRRVLGRIIGNDDFWVQILGHGSLTSLTDLIGGLMARARELRKDGFRSAAGELHALLDSSEEGKVSAVPGGLDTGYDTMLFHGLKLEEEIDIGDGLTMLPFERARAFVDETILADMVPDLVRFRD